MPLGCHRRQRPALHWPFRLHLLAGVAECAPCCRHHRGRATISLLQELLVLPLELAVEGDALLEALGFALVRTIDLDIMFDLARLSQLRVELLVMVLAAVRIAAVRFEQVASTVGQHDCDVSVAVQRNGSDETVLAKMAEVTSA